VVFALSPPGRKGFAWTTILHTFPECTGTSADGCSPHAGLVRDKKGNLYGTTESGGTKGNGGFGTAFELSPPASTESQLHSFKFGKDGYNPLGGLIFGKSGNLYGTTNSVGGNYPNGSPGEVFELAPPAAGQKQWTKRRTVVTPTPALLRSKGQSLRYDLCRRVDRQTWNGVHGFSVTDRGCLI
jgi:uncharacterized repeat protein (TIGR03803 family)